MSLLLESQPPYVPDTLSQSLHDMFGFGEFRPLQEEAVRAALGGRDLLVVMPTGAGKSLCFQLPAAIQEGLTLVVSPLIALMRDQVDALNRRESFARLGCACLNSLQGADEQRRIRERLRAGQIRLLYVAPERFRSPRSWTICGTSLSLGSSWMRRTASVNGGTTSGPIT